jgi:hypothetical protein
MSDKTEDSEQWWAWDWSMVTYAPSPCFKGARFQYRHTRYRLPLWRLNLYLSSKYGRDSKQFWMVSADRKTWKRGLHWGRIDQLHPVTSPSEMT